MKDQGTKYVILAFLSAILFGASTPIGKLLLDSLPPFQLAGLLYLGAALGVLPFSIKNRNNLKIESIGKKNFFRLFGAIILGGVIGPVLLLYGLRIASSASVVAMWLNLELAATAALGYLIFKDHLGFFGWIGVVGTIFASVILSWNEAEIGLHALFLVGGASICWAFDNHLTALIDGISPTQSTFWKGIAAGAVNLIIGFAVEPFGKDMLMFAPAILVGIFSYGFSISLYILSAQNLGATRGQMLFSTAPFFGVVLSIIILDENLTIIQIVAALLLTMSLITLFRDQHSHHHVHETLHHNHNHKHDDNHHNHSQNEAAKENYHSHWHKHAPQPHAHPHWPDIHHRHEH